MARPAEPNMTAEIRRNVRFQEIIRAVPRGSRPAKHTSPAFGGLLSRRYRIVTGVPSGISRARRRTAGFGMRTQPWETRPGRISG